MKNFLKALAKPLQFLQEDNGNFSNARLLAFLSVGSFVTDWQHCIWTGIKFEPSLTVVGVVLGIVGAKVGQKLAEEKVLPEIKQ